VYILDTDHMSMLERGGAPALALVTKLSAIDDLLIATTIITYEEQCRGWLAKTAKETGPTLVRAYTYLGKHLDIFSNISIIQFNDQANELFQQLQRSKIRVGTQDLKIAAIVLANNAVLLTRNSRHFEKVPNLAFMDWTV